MGGDGRVGCICGRSHPWFPVLPYPLPCSLEDFPVKDEDDE